MPDTGPSHIENRTGDAEGARRGVTKSSAETSEDLLSEGSEDVEDHGNIIGIYIYIYIYIYISNPIKMMGT